MDFLRHNTITIKKTISVKLKHESYHRNKEIKLWKDPNTSCLSEKAVTDDTTKRER